MRKDITFGRLYWPLARDSHRDGKPRVGRPVFFGEATGEARELIYVDNSMTSG